MLLGRYLQNKLQELVLYKGKLQYKTEHRIWKWKMR